MRTILLCSLLAAGCGNAYTYAANDQSVADLSSPPDHAMVSPQDCDLVQQNCGDPTLKCALHIDVAMDMGGDSHQCVAPKGTLTEGKPCTRATFGDDNCAAGLVCTLRGEAAGALACRKFCHTDSDCKSGDQCSGQVSQAFPMDGMCIPTCKPFTSSCGAGLTCAELSLGVGSTMMKPRIAFLCRSPGSKLPGDPCTGTPECGADQICNPRSSMPTCLALCDDAHACGAGDPDAGLSCTPIPTLTTGVCN